MRTMNRFRPILLAAAIGATGLAAVPSSASAFDLPPLPPSVSVDTKQPLVPTTHCEKNACLPDYRVDIEATKDTRVINGRLTYRFVVTLWNSGLAAGGAVNSALVSEMSALRDLETRELTTIALVEQTGGPSAELTWHPDTVFGTFNVWNVYQPNGMQPGEDTTFDVWVAHRWDASVGLRAHTNTTGRYGTTAYPFRGTAPEYQRSNNRDRVDL